MLIWDFPSFWPLVVATGLLLTVAVLWFYPPQTRGAGFARGALPLLRWVGVGALVLSLLGPVMLLPKSADEWGAVVVLLDCSKSMSVTDPGRTPAEQVALAAALGRLPTGVRSDAAASLTNDIQRLESRRQDVVNAYGDLDYARVAGRGVSDKQALLRQVADRYADTVQFVLARSGGILPGTELRQQLQELSDVPAAESREAWGLLRDHIEKSRASAERLQAAADRQLYESDPAVRVACDSLAKLSRLSLAEQALLDTDSGLIARMGRRVPFIGYAIDDGLELLPLTAGGRPVESLEVKPAALRSDLTGAQAMAVAALSPHPIRAVVLFSDGRQVGGGVDVTSAVRPSGVPVFTVGVAPPQVPDVWISGVSLSATSAFSGETIEGRIDVRCDGPIAPPKEVQVIGSFGSVTEPLELVRPAGRRPPGTDLAARFAVPMAPKDGQVAEKLVFSVPLSPGETTAANNRVERWIKVSGDKLKAAICTAAPTWDFQYLRAALSRRAWVTLDARVLDADRPRLALAPGQILDQNVLVLCDVPVDALDVNQWDAVGTLAATRGGSVILVAGGTSSLAEYSTQPIARGLLPFHDVRPTWKEWPGEQPAFHFVPTPLAQRELLGFGEGADGGRRRWQDLSGLYRYLQVPEKSLYPDVQKLLLEAESGSPVLTERRLGTGRVFFLGLDETWRWRLKNDDREAERFWRQLVRYAAGEPSAVNRGPISLDLDKMAVNPGEPVNVKARIRDARSPSPAARTCPLEILRDGRLLSVTTLRALGRGQFAGAVRDLPQGDYQFRLRGTGPSGAALDASVPLHVGESDEAEMRQISGDPDMLKRIARSTGGRYFPIDQVDRLPESLNALRETQSQFVRRPLWNSPFLYGLVLACLSAEWALRKRFGLA